MRCGIGLEASRTRLTAIRNDNPGNVYGDPLIRVNCLIDPRAGPDSFITARKQLIRWEVYTTLVLVT